jgi:Anti-sigma-K factor rskA, C-terminal
MRASLGDRPDSGRRLGSPNRPDDHTDEEETSDGSEGIRAGSTRLVLGPGRSRPRKLRTRCDVAAFEHDSCLVSPKEAAHQWRLLEATVRFAVLKRRRPADGNDREIVELAALADGSLAPERRAALEAQVAASPELADRLDEQQRAVALAYSAAGSVEAPAALRTRIDAQRRVPPPRAQRRPVMVGAAAAAVLTAALVAAIVLRSNPATERFHAALAPTTPASGATGEATLTRTSSGWRIELDATGLPRLAGGRFYEAWLRNPAGVLVPVGTFNAGHDVTLWAGVAPKAFTTLTITRERADNDQRSSGDKVLVGTVTAR